MTFKLQTAAASEPVTTEELKAQLRITHSSQDTMLASLIKAARQRAEFYTRRALITSVWDLFLDSFPDSGDCIW
ncbi:MAG TPA: head-tail connector protein, partial [Bacteroidales bacterium]|nr:head-tail connector protein [Bacteroidales bacterium]